MNNKLLAALISMTLLACGAPIVPAGEDLTGSSAAELKATARRVAPLPRATSQVQVSDTATNPVFKSSFVIANTYDVFFAFNTAGALAGQHIAAFEITSPNGAMYQRTEVPFTPGTSTQYRVWSSMAVAGTWITQYAITGTWTVKVYLDAELTPRSTHTFVLQ